MICELISRPTEKNVVTIKTPVSARFRSFIRKCWVRSRTWFYRSKNRAQIVPSPTEFSYLLDMHCDVCGSFTDILRTPNRGQFSVIISKPGITRANIDIIRRKKSSSSFPAKALSVFVQSTKTRFTNILWAATNWRSSIFRSDISTTSRTSAEPIWLYLCGVANVSIRIVRTRFI